LIGTRFLDAQVGSSPEKESLDCVWSQHPPQLLDAEKWEKSSQNDKTIGEQFMGPYPQELSETSH
jgi:hypothetical protein